MKSKYEFRIHVSKIPHFSVDQEGLFSLEVAASLNVAFLENIQFAMYFHINTVLYSTWLYVDYVKKKPFPTP
jgi:hypothetical protein